MLELEEPWRVVEEFKRDQIVKGALPELDEAYIRAVMKSGHDYQAAWAFGLLAKGRPHTTGFLSHRIGAGLMKLMHDFFQSGAERVNESIAATIGSDLKGFRPTDPRLADLARLYLHFLRFVSSGDNPGPREKLREVVLKFNQANPTDMAGVQMAYLLAQLDDQGPEPWETMKQYTKALGSTTPGPGFLSIFAGAAVRRTVKTGDLKPMQEVLVWIRDNAAAKTRVPKALWKAHLLAVTGLLSDEATIGARLQEAVNAYTAFIQSWDPSDGSGATPQHLCDAVASLATLLMQGGAGEEARTFMGQIQQACAEQPAALAVTAVVDLALGKDRGTKPAEILRELIPRLASEQAKIQSHLWLAVTAQAAGDEKAAKESFQAAAKSIRSERQRGAKSVLAPDRRSMVAMSGSFNMSTGYSDQSPFGLILEVDVTTRMILFPPAAVDEAKMVPFLKPQKGN
jgi:hypothetical protein